MFGCELRRNKSSGVFWRYAYDGQDFIEFNKEIPAWVALDPAALNTKQKWEAEEVYVQRAKAYLEEECPGMLRRYLKYSRTHLDRQGTHCFLRPALPTSPFPHSAEKDQGDLRLGAQGTSQANPLVIPLRDGASRLGGEEAGVQNVCPRRMKTGVDRCEQD